MSTVKCGYGDRDCHGHGHSKPLMKYHSKKAPASVTTVVTEISGKKVNEKHAFLEEDSVHRGGTVQKHGGSAAMTHQYKQEEEEEESDSSEESGDESDCEEELAYGQYVAGGVQKHGYGEQKAYQHGGDAGGYAAFRHDSSIENHGYGGQQAYQDGGYGALHHDTDSTVQKKLGYGEQKAYQVDVAGDDALVQSSAAQKHGHSEQKAYNRGLVVQGYQSQQRGLYFLIWPPKRRWWL